ncbi:MAG: DUF2147 domain-containing protein [Rhodopseudomonas sp.]|uniref:DUF2147 domain-containing protein n=1 Tax=Rhodopseudomonas sp. TaxID=1078 RepID=UPI0017A2351B|nr:DUF2147 domain-containing protein [Rhodopseudomonas sp.]NVN87690.1 DUF2147 domain-containing protein [Rhodopseudomonas sp.]
MLQRLRNTTRALLLCGLFCSVGLAPALASDPTGDWRVADAVADIRVAECHGSMWGAVVWEKIPGAHDKNNPDPAKVSRPTLGMAILFDMKKKPGADQWDGTVYNAKDGKIYDSSIKVAGPDRLEIQGCLLGFLCGSETWTRVKGPIPSSPSNSPAGTRATPNSHMAKAGLSEPAARTAVPPAGMPNTVGQRPTALPAADPVGDICLLPEIARLAH